MNNMNNNMNNNNSNNNNNNNNNDISITQNNPRTADAPSVALTKQKSLKFPSELFNGERWVTQA